LQHALSQPVSVVITGIDAATIQDQAFQVASHFKPLSEAQLAAITGKTAEAAANGSFELFKTSSHFDSTAQHPEWLGPETPQVREMANT
jgi:uncharacterized protein